MQYYSKTVTKIWKHQSQHMIYFHLQNQSYHIQILGIEIREHRKPAFCVYVFLFCYYHEDIPWGTIFLNMSGASLFLEFSLTDKTSLISTITLMGRGREREKERKKKKKKRHERRNTEAIKLTCGHAGQLSYQRVFERQYSFPEGQTFILVQDSCLC